MPKENLQKHTLNLYAGDYEELQSLYPETGAAIVVRHIVRKFLEQAARAGSVKVDDVSIKL